METYLILSGEGHWKTEHVFLMECLTLEEAEEKFAEFKAGDYKDTDLFIYKAVKVGQMDKPNFLTDKLIRDYAKKVPTTPEEFEESFMDYVRRHRLTLDSRYIKDKLSSHVEFLKKFPPAEKWKFDDSEFTNVAHKVIEWLKVKAIKDQYGHSFSETSTGIPIDRTPDEQSITEALLRKWVTYEQLRDLCFFWIKYPKIPRSKEEWAEQILWAKTFK